MLNLTQYKATPSELVRLCFPFWELVHKGTTTKNKCLILLLRFHFQNKHLKQVRLQGDKPCEMMRSNVLWTTQHSVSCFYLLVGKIARFCLLALGINKLLCWYYTYLNVGAAEVMPTETNAQTAYIPAA